MKRLAINDKGELTWCNASEENIGKRRCNHILHQNIGETVEEFNKRYENLINNNINDCNKKPIVYYFSKGEIKERDDSLILGGSQPKTATKENKYIKFDKEEKDKFGRIVRMYSNPSIAEAISSCLIRNSNIQSRIRCTDYHLCIIDDENNKKTASISDSYIFEDEKEFLLASNYGKSDKTLMSGTDYREDILNGLRPRDKIIDAIYNEMKMPLDKIKQQLEDKCALDILLINSDVSNNPMNFVITRNVKNGESNIVSMDYGRCLTNNPCNTYYFELPHDFKPFEININDFKKEAKEIISAAYSVSDELGSYADDVLDICLNNLDKNKKLWKNDLGGIQNEN